MTLDDMFDALRGLGKQRWAEARLGMANTGQDRLWETPFDLNLVLTRTERWLWPDDLAVSFDLEWLTPVEVTWLAPVKATLVQPINLLGVYAGEPVVGIPGLIIWPDWTDLNVDPHHYDPPWVIPVPDEQGRVLAWERASLAAAVSIKHDLDSAPVEELAEAVGLKVVASRHEGYARPEPLSEEPF